MLPTRNSFSLVGGVPLLALLVTCGDLTMRVCGQEPQRDTKVSKPRNGETPVIELTRSGRVLNICHGTFHDWAVHSSFSSAANSTPRCMRRRMDFEKAFANLAAGYKKRNTKIYVLIAILVSLLCTFYLIRLNHLTITTFGTSADSHYALLVESHPAMNLDLTKNVYNRTLGVSLRRSLGGSWLSPCSSRRFSLSTCPKDRIAATR